MTDGVSNIQNAIPPQIAAELAKNNNIRYILSESEPTVCLNAYTQDIFGDLIFTETEVAIDEATLREIAQTTGGKYFRATSNSSLEEIYNEINQLEKTDVKVSKLYNYEEYFKIFLWIAWECC
jgi:Ca-activated chloride channel family protein